MLVTARSRMLCVPNNSKGNHPLIVCLYDAVLRYDYVRATRMIKQIQAEAIFFSFLSSSCLTLTCNSDAFILLKIISISSFSNSLRITER